MPGTVSAGLHVSVEHSRVPTFEVTICDLKHFRSRQPPSSLAPLNSRRIRSGTLNSDFVAAGLLSLGVLVAGCDNAPPGTHPQSPQTETSAKQVAGLIRSAEGRDGQ